MHRARQPVLPLQWKVIDKTDLLRHAVVEGQKIKIRGANLGSSLDHILINACNRRCEVGKQPQKSLQETTNLTIYFGLDTVGMITERMITERSAIRIAPTTRQSQLLSGLSANLAYIIRGGPERARLYAYETTHFQMLPSGILNRPESPQSVRSLRRIDDERHQVWLDRLGVSVFEL